MVSSSKHLEIDVIFPRNETYLPADVFPIAIAIQNVAALDVLGNYTINWAIMPYIEGRYPGIATRGSAHFALPSETQQTGPTILVDTDNVTTWINFKARGERCKLLWTVTWDNHDLEERCQSTPSYILGGLMFGIEAEWKKRFNGFNGSDGWVDGGKGILPDIAQLPECPVLGQTVSITPDTTASRCPTITFSDAPNKVDAGGLGNPCAVKFNQSVAGSISSHATSLAAARVSPTTTSLVSASSQGAGTAPRPIKTALVAVYLLGGLLLPIR